MATLLPKPQIILTHESDLDGFLSGLLLQRLAQSLFSESIPLEAYHYTAWKQRELRERSAWISDFSFEPRLDRPEYLIVDHHTTDAVPQKAQLIHHLQKSAATLAYEICGEHGLVSPELDRLVHLNNVADLFLEEDPDFVLANDYANLVKTYGFWNLHEMIEGRPEKLLDHPLLEVMRVKRQVEDPLGYSWSAKNVDQIAPRIGLVNTIVGNTNLIVHQLLEKGSTPFPVLITLFRKSNGVVIASLRSRNGEAIKVAERLQGGGHPNASGATLPRAVKTIPDAVEYLKKVLNPSPSRTAPLQSLGQIFDGLTQ